MAGNYPDVPSWRMAWDLDGTQGFKINASTVYDEYSPSERAAFNDETMSRVKGSGAASFAVFVFIFPELRDLDGYMLNGDQWGGGGVNPVEVSDDTTNGTDGTWTSYVTAYNLSSSKEIYRNGIAAGTALGVKAIRFTTPATGFSPDVNPTNFHLYGEPSPGENLQRLEIWHPTLDQRIGPADLDWGDVPRSSTETREFRIKNMDPALTANSVRAAMSILTDTTPSVVGQMAISKDGSTWGSQQTLTSPLGPGDIGPVMYIRRTTPSNAALSLWWYRLFADCTSWT